MLFLLLFNQPVLFRTHINITLGIRETWHGTSRLATEALSSLNLITIFITRSHFHYHSFWKLFRPRAWWNPKSLPEKRLRPLNLPASKQMVFIKHFCMDMKPPSPRQISSYNTLTLFKSNSATALDPNRQVSFATNLLQRKFPAHGLHPVQWMKPSSH